MANFNECNFFDIFGLTSNDNYYKSRISLQDGDKYYSKNSIFKYDDKIFDNFLWFYEDKQLIIESIERRKLDDIFRFKIKDDYSIKYPPFINLTIEKNLFRFMSEKWALEAYLNGSFRINNALGFIKDEHNKARKDNESLIIEDLNNCFARHQKSGKTFKVNNAFKTTYTTDINNYILCMAYEFDKRLFSEFNADLCLVITDPKEFQNRIKNKIDNYSLFSSRISYSSIIHGMGIMFSKDKIFKIQKEFRFLWSDLDNPKIYSSNDIEKGGIIYHKNNLPEFFEISIGSLKDISFLIDKNGNRINSDI